MDGGSVDSIGLKIQQVLRSDMGNYTCELQNEFGTGVSQDAIALDVHCKCAMCINYVVKSACEEKSKSV